MATIEELLTTNEEKMKKTISYLREDLAGLRAGRATPAQISLPFARLNDRTE